jgi:hypothetical protein
MKIDGRGLISARLRRPVSFLLYSFIVIQWIVLLSVIRQEGQNHPLTFRTLLLPVLYLGPLAICFAFRQHIGVLRRKALLTVEITSLCNDWITVVLFMVYGILLDFRALS